MDRSIVHLLEAATCADPGHEAVRHGTRVITYGGLWAMVRSVCGFCRDKGIAPGDRVVLALPSDIEYVACYYGLLAAGAVVIPINAETPPAQAVRMMSACDTHWLVTSGHGHGWRELFAAVPQLKMLLVGLRPEELSSNEPVFEWREVLSLPPADPVYDLIGKQESLATIACTSGTTGDPKGVMITHGNIAANTRSILGYLPLSHDDVGVCVLPLYYAYGSSILNTHIAAGARVTLSKGMAYPQTVGMLLATEQATGFFGVPSTYYHLLNHNVFAEHALPNLRYLTQAGGGMRPQAIDQIRSQLPHAQFYVMYGQTEATARLAWLPPPMLGTKRGSIGIAVPGVELAVLDDGDRPMPEGEIGELCARGQNVMAGYWRNPEATQRVLRNGWLHTGDLAWQDEDGYLYLVGRADEMIKSGGHRIAPAAVEEVLCAHPEVEQAAVVGVEDPLLGQAVRAVVVPRAGCTPSAQSILHFCRLNLAPYMVPKQLLFMSNLPMTESGKVKRKMLVNLGDDNHASTENVGFAV